MKLKPMGFILCLIIGIMLIPMSGKAQRIAYEQGEKVAQIGLGFGYAGIYGDWTLPPITAALDFGYNENISIGGLIAYSSSEDKYSFLGESWGWKYTYIGIGARGAYHYGLFDSEKIDTYGGAVVGYNIVSSSVIGTDYGTVSASGGYLLWGGFLGGRYFFSPNIAFFTELGYGIGYITAGLSMKF